MTFGFFRLLTNIFLKTPTGSDHQTSGMVSLGRRRHVMPTGFRQADAVEFAKYVSHRYSIPK